MYKGTAFQFEFVSKRILQRHLRLKMPCRSTVRDKLILKIHGTVFKEFFHAANWTIH